MGGGLARALGRPGGAGAGAGGLLGADLLVGADGLAGVLRQAGLGGRAGAHRRGLRVQRAHGERSAAAGCGPGGGVGGLRQCAVAPGPAGLAAGVVFAGLHQPHDTQLHADRTGAGVRRGRPRQGPERGAHPLAPCPAQCPGAAGHGDCAELCRAAGGLGADRNRVRLAGPGPVHHQLAAERRHECRAGWHAGGGHGLHRPEPAE